MPRPLTRFLKVERLEDRAVPAVFLGTETVDRFSLNTWGPNSVLVSRYDAGNVLRGQAVVVNDSIEIDSLGGDDVIIMDSALPLAFYYDGGTGNDALFQFNSPGANIQDLGAKVSVVNGVGGGFGFDDASVEQVLFYGTAADNLFDVQSGPSNTALAFNGLGGYDTVRILNTSNATLGDAGTVVKIDRPSSGTIYVNDGDVEALYLSGTAGNDSFNLGPLPNYTAVGLTGLGGTDRATIFGLNNATTTDYGSYGGVYNPGQAPVYFNDGDLEELVLYGAAGNDSFTIQAMTSTVIAVNGGGGSDSVAIPNLSYANLQDYGAYSIAGIGGAATVFISDTDIESIYLMGTPGADTFDIIGLPNYAAVAVLGGAGVDTIQLRGLQNVSVDDFGSYGAVTVLTPGAGTLYFSDEADNLNLYGTVGDDTFMVKNRPTNTAISVTGLSGTDAVNIDGLLGGTLTDFGSYGVLTSTGGGSFTVSDNDIEKLNLNGTEGDDVFELGQGLTYAEMTLVAGAGEDTVRFRNARVATLTKKVFDNEGTIQVTGSALMNFLDNHVNRDPDIEHLEVYGTDQADTMTINGLTHATQFQYFAGAGFDEVIFNSPILNPYFVDFGSYIQLNYGSEPYPECRFEDGIVEKFTHHGEALSIFGSGPTSTVIYANTTYSTFVYDVNQATITDYDSNYCRLVRNGGGIIYWLVDEDISLFGTDGADTFDARTSNQRYIRFFGLAGNDVLYADKFGGQLDGGDGNDLLYGGPAMDHLVGNAGDDTIFGGGGPDELWGGTGNDMLYGEEGDDILHGEDGNDSLFGGAGNNTLSGNAGRDILLVWQRTGFTDSVSGLASEDAKIIFKDTTATSDLNFNGYPQTFQFAAASWSESEIATVATTLTNLQKATNNTKLLKKADGGELTFVRYGDQLSFTNIIAWGGINLGDGMIGVMNSSVNAGPTAVAKTVFRELGHNWDDPSENTFNSTTFRNLSGWVQSATSPGAGYTASTGAGDDWWYLSTATFARDLGKLNPFEDYATTWETYFTELYYGSGSSGNTLVAAKLANIADFVAWIRTP